MWVDYRVRITPDLLLYLRLLPISALMGKICSCIAVGLGLVLLLWYPRQIILHKHFMRKIDITNLENLRQAPTTGELKTQGVEDSPLLVGL